MVVNFAPPSNIRGVNPARDVYLVAIYAALVAALGGYYPGFAGRLRGYKY